MEESPKQSSFRHRLSRHWSWKIFPVAALTLLILYGLVLWLGDLSELGPILAGADWRWFLVALVILIINLAIGTYRFRMVVNAMGYKTKTREIFDAIISVWPLGLVIPSRGNDLLRAVILRDRIPGWKCTGALLAERFVDLHTLSLFAAVGFALIGMWAAAGLAILGWLTAWIALLLAIYRSETVLNWSFLSGVAPKIEALLAAFEALRDQPKYLMAVMLLSAAAWINVILIVIVLCAAFGVEAPWTAILALWPVALVVGMLPLTVAGMGTRDAAFVALLAVEQPEIVELSVLAVTISYGVVTMVVPALIGVPFLIRHIAKM